MLEVPKCFTRKCQHYQGVKWFGEEESTERNICKAFPDGIPDEIAYRDNKHSKPLPGQKNNIVFEPRK